MSEQAGTEPWALEMDELRLRLQEAEDTLEAIRSGGVDALVVGDAAVYTLEGADSPYRTVLNTMHEGVVTLTGDSTIVYCNPRLSDMIGVPSRRVLGQRFGKFFAGQSVESINRMLDAPHDASQTAEATLLKTDGETLPVRLSVTTFTAGAAPMFSVLVTDLTEQKRAERLAAERAAEILARERVAKLAEQAQRQAAEMEAQRNQLQAITTNTPAALLFLDGQDSTVKWHNDRYTRVLDERFVGQDLTGRKLSEFVPTAEEEGVAAVIRQAAQGQLVAIPEFEYLGFERGPTYFNWMAVPVPRGDRRGYDVLIMTTDITEQVRARQQVETLAREAQTRATELDTIINSIADGVGVYDTEGRIVRRNGAFERLLQYPEEEWSQPVSQRHGARRVYDVNRMPLPIESTPVARALRGETLTGMTVIFETGSGEDRILSVSASPLHAPDGTITGAVLGLTDVGPLHRAQEELRRSEARFRALVKASSQVMYRMSPDWTQMRDLAGGDFLADTGTPSRNWLETYIPPEDQAEVLKVIAEAIRTRSVFELEHRVRRVDGSLGWTISRAVPILDESGAITEWFGMASDITDRKQAEEALQRSESLLRRAQEIAYLGSWELDLTSGVLTWSDEVYRIFGLRPQEFPATYEAFLDAVHPDDRAVVDEAYMGSVREGRDSYEIEHRIIRRNSGEVRIVHERGEHVRDASGAIVGSVGMVHDVTERRRVEDELRELQAHLEEIVIQRTASLVASEQRSRALAKELTLVEQRERQRLAEAIHDGVVQTLGAIKIHLQLLGMTKPDAPDGMANVVRMLDEAVTQSRDLISEISPRVLLESGLGPALRWWASQVQQKHGLNVQVVTDQEPPRLSPEVEAILYRSVRELLQNALKHAQAHQVVVRVACSGTSIGITVQDDGVGFDRSAVEAGAGGFGLFSIRERVATLGGSLDVRSAPGRGSSFEISLPIPCGAAGKALAPEPAEVS